MDTAAYRFDEGNFYGGDEPLSRTGRVDALDVSDARGASGVRNVSGVAPNPFGRDAWVRPQGAGGRPGNGAGSTTARSSSPQRRQTRGLAVAPTATPGVVAAMLGGLARTGRAARGRRIGRRHWHLWSVLGVAALSVFVVVALFQMANLYAEGLGLAGPGIASPTADASVAAADAGGGTGPLNTARRVARRRAAALSLPDRPQYRDAPMPAPRWERAGCGPTSLAMVYIALTGEEEPIRIPPPWPPSGETEGCVEEGLTAWRFAEGRRRGRAGGSSHGCRRSAGGPGGGLRPGASDHLQYAPRRFHEHRGHFLVVAGIDRLAASWSFTTNCNPPTALSLRGMPSVCFRPVRQPLGLRADDSETNTPRTPTVGGDLGRPLIEKDRRLMRG